MSEEMIEALEKEDSEVMTDEEVKKARKAKLRAIWNKVTTGILILLLASPILILAYIFLWFIFR